MNEIERAYLAGFFDADGAIMASIERHREMKFGFRVRLTIRIAQKNRNLLDQIQKELGYGHVRLNRSVHEYDIKDQKHVSEFVSLISPYSKMKQTQLVMAQQIYSGIKRLKNRDDLVRLAKLADTLAEFNVRSKNRRKNYAKILF